MGIKIKIFDKKIYPLYEVKMCFFIHSELEYEFQLPVDKSVVNFQIFAMALYARHLFSVVSPYLEQKILNFFGRNLVNSNSTLIYQRP